MERNVISFAIPGYWFKISDCIFEIIGTMILHSSLHSEYKKVKTRI